MSESGANESQALVVSQLCHRFGGLTALDEVSFGVGRGEVFGLLGPNGSGKSTILSIVAGQLRVQEGQVSLFGFSLPSEQRKVAPRLGVIFQSPALDPHLSARENLSLAGQMYGLSGKGLKRRIEERLEQARLAERADEQVSNFSGGMKRRLDLIRALLHDPDVLLLDEPTTGLDESSFQDFWSRLSLLRGQRELTVIVATHRPEEGEYCDRVAILVRGSVVEIDSPASLKRSVSKDVVVVSGRNPKELSSEVDSLFGTESVVTDGELFIESDAGHELIPRLVESFESGRIASISLRQPTLADVFLKSTGESLRQDSPEAA